MSAFQDRKVVMGIILQIPSSIPICSPLVMECLYSAKSYQSPSFAIMTKGKKSSRKNTLIILFFLGFNDGKKKVSNLGSGLRKNSSKNSYTIPMTHV